ncbi:family 16 glycoside hydrolase [uncultured Algibacter sp.]|uniref:family 16 glycoside hydrolase n=1 Tax=uncultured Algibacter sp. TaxID=298659 RepID=UPI002624CE6C|nr:family 16 glycoside hydrolase [uncultured Algibacter sp.]
MILYPKPLIILFSLVMTSVVAQKKATTINLLDANLSHFEKFIGVPHETVIGLSKDTPKSEDVTKGVPLGINNDLKNVFTTTNIHGETILNISGEIYGCITTKDNYSNYHFSTMFKWGNKKWEPRLKQKKDSGILYHSYGDHGRFWNTWKTCLEFQVQETDLGDFISLPANSIKPNPGGPIVQIRGNTNSEKKQYDPNFDTYFEGKGYIHAYLEPQTPHGNWNHLELYVVGNNAVHVVNGKVVMVVENAINPETKKPLTEGQIQIQSEAAECYYKNMTLTPITKFPKFIREDVKFKL